MPAVHVAICGLATLAAGFVQLNWSSAFSRDLPSAPPANAFAAIIAVTAWLVATAWLHRDLGRRGDRRLVLAQNAARLSLLADSMLAGVAAAMIWRGHESPLFPKAIWTLCPVILVIAILSATAIGLARADVLAPRNPGPSTPPLLVARLVLGVILVLVFAAASTW
jgi:hypothetical protein